MVLNRQLAVNMPIAAKFSYFQNVHALVSMKLIFSPNGYQSRYSCMMNKCSAITFVLINCPSTCSEALNTCPLND